MQHSGFIPEALQHHEKTRPWPRFFLRHKTLVLGFVDDFVGTNPRHHGAQLLTDDFDTVSSVVTTLGSHRRVAGCAFTDEHLSVFAVLDAFQSIAHGLTGLGVDDFRAGHVLAVLGVVGDRVVHVGDTAFVHEVNDQLQFVQTLEVGHFRRVTGFNQSFKAGFNQLNGTATQNGLLAEQVGFGFVFESGFDDAGATATHASGVGQRNVLGVARSVLIDSDQVRDTAALDELGTYGVARSLRRDHDHVEIATRHDLVVVNRETVGEGQGSALLDVRLDFVFVQGRLELVRGQDHDQVGSSNSRSNVSHFQAMGFSLGYSGGAFTQANSHVNTGLFQVARLSVALGTVANDGNFLALDDREVTIFVVINFHVLGSFNRKGMGCMHRDEDTLSDPPHCVK